MSPAATATAAGLTFWLAMNGLTKILVGKSMQHPLLRGLLLAWEEGILTGDEAWSYLSIYEAYFLNGCLPVRAPKTLPNEALDCLVRENWIETSLLGYSPVLDTLRKHIESLEVI